MVPLLVAAVTVLTTPVSTFSTTITGMLVIRSKLTPVRVTVPEEMVLGEMAVSEGLDELPR